MVKTKKNPAAQGGIDQYYLARGANAGRSAFNACDAQAGNTDVSMFSACAARSKGYNTAPGMTFAFLTNGFAAAVTEVYARNLRVLLGAEHEAQWCDDRSKKISGNA